jgi:general secretion pathway protein F
MAVYLYKALNAKGKQVKGVIDADSTRGARLKLKQLGMFPTHVEETQQRQSTYNINLSTLTNRSRKISVSQLAVLTRQLATLSAAGMPLVDALKALADQIDQTSLRSIIAEVSDKVNEGSTLANSMRSYPQIFPRIYVNMISSGEASGSLDMVLERLADLLESQAALRRKIMSALTYPILMCTLCFGVIMLLMAYVVPQITIIFKEQHATLPVPTRIIIALSDFVRSYWYLILLAVIALPSGLKYYAQTKKGRKRIDTLILSLPVIGGLKLKIATSRLARNLGLMLSSGIEMLTALTIARNIIGNVILEECVQTAAEGVREGGSLAVELNKSGRFPRLLIHMVAIGEKTGQLETMLVRAASVYESEVDSVVSGFTSILEPLLIIFLALIVGTILAAVMLPMLEMTSMMHG